MSMAPGTSGMRQAMGVAEWGLLLLLGLVWGGSFFFAKIALGAWPPLMVVLGRVGFGALLLNGVVLLTGQRMPANWRLWKALIVMGLLNSVIPFCLIAWGQQGVSSGLASILYATTSLFTVLLAPLFVSGETLTVRRLAGVLTGLLGVAIMLGPDVLADVEGTTLTKLAILGAALSYALGSIWGRRFRDVPSAIAAAGQLTVAALVVAPLSLLIDRPWTFPLPSVQVIGAIAGLALLSTTVGYLLYFTLLGRAGAVNTSLVTLLVPPSALLLGTLFLTEPIESRDLLGLVFIAVGLVTIDGRLPRWLWHQVKPQPV